MLPFHKRTPRTDDFEDLHTGDLMEVVGPVVAKSSHVPASFPAPPSSRPQMFREPSSTDEVTCLMPAKGYGTLPPPPRSVRPSVSAPVQSFRPPQHQGFVHQQPHQQPQQLDAESTRTDYRTLPPTYGSFPPPPRAPFAMSAMPQPIPQSMLSTIPPAPGSFSPVAYSMSTAKSDSDARIDPPATVITTRTKVLTGRPTLSWGAALVAMGIFGGLVTAVLARGDGDALVDATASFVDPAHAAHAAQAPAVESKLVTATPMLQNPAPAPVSAAPAPTELGVVATTTTPAVTTPAADPIAAKPATASMAYSHPAQAVEKKAEPKALEAPKAAAPAPLAAKAAIKPWTPPARPAAAPPAEKAEKAEKTTTAKADKKGSASKDDLASAKEAKALADAQLEASLR